MKDLFITDKINLTLSLPIGKDPKTILLKVGGFYAAYIDGGDNGATITVRNVNLLDVGFVVTLINGIEDCWLGN